MAGLAAAVLALSACGGGPSESVGASGPTGQAVSGGTGRIVEQAEPRSLDPAVVANSWANSPVLGNSLYGTLLIDDPSTGKIDYKLAQSLDSADGGKTFTLKLRDGVKFSDGTPYDADAVKFGWDHIKDPSTASPDAPQAALIQDSRVIDPTTLEVTLVEPVPSFANAVLQTSMNWIASPAALKAGQQAFDEHPIGAGPFTLDQWSRQDVIKLTRNAGYFGEPAHLDKLEIRAVADNDQRYNTVSTGQADLAMEGRWTNIAKAKAAGLQTEQVDMSGGVVIVMNTTKAPFDDPRARKAFALSLDLQGIDDAISNGDSEIPETLFAESSPFYQDIKLPTDNRADAQKLFDELAADGKPFHFTMSVYPTTRDLGEAVQTQMSTMKNVKVDVRTVDLAQVGQIMAQKDYDTLVSSVAFTDPEPRLWFSFHSTSRGNTSGINDPQLDAALEKGRLATSETDRKAAYTEVQNRLVELNPVIFYERAAPAVIAASNVGGLRLYGTGSLLPETLWLSE